MVDFQLPPVTASPIPAADVSASEAAGNVEYEAYPVRKPEADLNDFKIQVRASTIVRCRAKLAHVSNSLFPWHEVALGASTLAAGAFLGALPADIKAGSLQGIFFYTVLPIIAVSTFVTYFFLRRLAIREPADIAKEVLSELPDPDKTH